MTTVIVSGGPVDTLFEQIEVSHPTLGRFPGARCRACRQAFLCEGPASVPAHSCSGFSIVGSLGESPDALSRHG